MPDTPPPQPDSKRLFDLLMKVGIDAGDACALVQEVSNMAAANLITRFESRLEARNAKIDAHSAEFSSFRWTMGLGFTMLAPLLYLVRFVD
ncbi:MAG: hypothetical protein OXN89_22385 [Bryobacterales bacterium]|nr:hypothetical protein [Bryobacterales bacterium]